MQQRSHAIKSTYPVFLLQSAINAIKRHLHFQTQENLFGQKNLCDFACSFPREQLVACAFHRPVKIDPESLSLWALIILSHPSAILWIISYEESALENLVRELDYRSLSGRCCKRDFKMMIILLHCRLCCFSTQANTFN